MAQSARGTCRLRWWLSVGRPPPKKWRVRLPDVISTVESVGTFLWPGAGAQESIPFRYSADDAERRSINEVAMPELVGLVRARPDLVASDDPALALAREIGLARLARSARERLEEALESCHSDG